MGRKISLSAPFFLFAMLAAWVVFPSLEAYAMERRWPAQVDRKHERYEFQIGDLKLLVPARILQPAFWVKPPEDRSYLHFFVTFPGPYFQDSEEQRRCMAERPSWCEDLVTVMVHRAIALSPAAAWAYWLPHLNRSMAGDVHGLEFFERGTMQGRSEYARVEFGTTLLNGDFIVGRCTNILANKKPDWDTNDLLKRPGVCDVRFYLDAQADVSFRISAKQLPHLAEIQEFLAALTQSMAAEPGVK